MGEKTQAWGPELARMAQEGNTENNDGAIADEKAGVYDLSQLKENSSDARTIDVPEFNKQQREQRARDTKEREEKKAREAREQQEQTDKVVAAVRVQVSAMKRGDIVSEKTILDILNTLAREKKIDPTFAYDHEKKSSIMKAFAKDLTRILDDNNQITPEYAGKYAQQLDAIEQHMIDFVTGSTEGLITRSDFTAELKKAIDKNPLLSHINGHAVDALSSRLESTIQQLDQHVDIRRVQQNIEQQRAAAPQQSRPLISPEARQRAVAPRSEQTQVVQRPSQPAQQKPQTEKPWWKFWQ